ncbi:hypothetical protein M433DRAFT_401183 [Acidomyces richmondensis BFW]|nr:MAG: hypothetical protein FE78DRAFT_204705 [Acidomyces sp. 'richmondensis']KYG48622.1 hypothetical protein M433DRAFT_401183 [Acidomyces richmondensis BFW]
MTGAARPFFHCSSRAYVKLVATGRADISQLVLHSRDAVMTMSLHRPGVVLDTRVLKIEAQPVLSVAQLVFSGTLVLILVAYVYSCGRV